MSCYFCQRNIREINFQEYNLLKKFISGLAKIKSRKKTGLCATHQRKIAKAIKKARILGILPFVPR